MFHRCVLSIVFVATSTCAWAAGFQIIPTVNAIGRYMAGNGIAGDEIGDLYFNPAGSSLQPRTGCEVGFIFLTLENEFNDQGSSITAKTPLGSLTQPAYGIDDTTSDDGYLVTNFCSFHTRDPRLSLGIGLMPTFGLRSRYDSRWIGRYHAVDSELVTVNFNPSASYQLSDTLALGAGISVEYADATLSQAVFTGFGNPDGMARVDGDDFGFGYNIGAIWQANRTLRFGASFRSKIDHTLDGKRKLSRLGPLNGKIDAEAKTTLPETVFVSALYTLPGRSERWRLAATGRWTNWSRFDEIRVRFMNGDRDSVSPQGWQDSWSLGLALDWQIDDQWQATLGGGIDDSPIPNARLRGPRMPDADRQFIGANVIYRSTTGHWSTEFGYHRLFVGKRRIDNTIDLVPSLPGAVTHTLRGSYAADGVDVFAARASMSF